MISAQKGFVYISELKKYDLIIPELNFNYYYYSKKKQEKVVSKIVKRILDNNYDEIVIMWENMTANILFKREDEHTYKIIFAYL